MRYFGNNIKLIANNLVVSYTDEGPDEAPVIIFIHGFPLNKSMWNNQIEILKADYRVITYDIRGHGDSDTGNDSFSIELFVNDLISFMDVLRIKKATLCGLSMGGYIALNAIERYPDSFDALALCDTTCRKDSPEAKNKRKKTIERIIKDGVINFAGDSLKTLFTPDSFTTKADEISSVKKMILNTTELSLCSTLLALSSRNDTCSVLNDIKVPVLILVGAEDTITPPDYAMFMHENIKDSTLQIIDHAGHLSNLENPEVFNHHIKKFFDLVYKDQLIIDQTIDKSFLREFSDKIMMLLSFKPI
jgi:3-oxoadipate enol-lactonase